MHERLFLGIAGAFGALSVAIDAAASHLLANDAFRMELAATSARYGLIHAVALIGVTVLRQTSGGGRCLAAAAWLFVVGLVLFCGNLDVMAFGGLAGFARLVPWGGGAFIAGWLALLAAAVAARR